MTVDLYGISPALIARVVAVPATTARRWKSRPHTIPPHSARLLRAVLYGSLAEIWGDEWEGFQIRGGKLFIPLFERGFEPGQVKAMFFNVQELDWYRQEMRRGLAEQGRSVAFGLARSARPTLQLVPATSAAA